MSVPSPLLVWAQSLGCPKNRVDSERFLGSLGKPVKLVNHIGHARLVFINTCAFIEPATRESIRAIIDAIAKVNGLKRKPVIAVAGCLPQRYGCSELAKEFPEVNLWLETREQKDWVRHLSEIMDKEDIVEDGRLLSTGPSYAWLKISDGCDHRCSFCAIPAIKGGARSESPEKIVAEAKNLLSQGVKELVIVAQDPGSWGRDLPEKPDLSQLLQELATLRELHWLRLMYLHPSVVTDKLLAFFKHLGNPLLPYFDIPFQHTDAEILRAMRRPQRDNALAIVERIRKILPEAALRGTLITGFPGETESQFEALCQFVRDARFQNLGVFPFYAEEGTAASKLPGQLPEEVKIARRNRIMEIQAQISADLLTANIGKRMDVLVDSTRDEEWPGLRAGRVWFQAPEVDGVTFVSGEGVEPGRMVNCEIVDSQTYDLSALA